MKVLMIDHFSSISMYSTDLCNELGKIADVELLTVNDSALEGKQTYKYQKLLYGHFDGNKFMCMVQYLFSLIRCFGKIIFGKYDVIHIQSFRNISIESHLFKLTKKKKVKYIHTLHNVLPHEAMKKDITNYGRIYALCDHLIAHNKTTYSIFSEAFPELKGKVSIIPHGAYSYIRKMVQPKKVIEKTVFFMLGLIRKYKGIDILLEAVNKLPEDDKKKVHVVIAGRQDKRIDSTDYEGYIEQKELRECVTFIPQKITDEKMAEFYNISDICVFPYRSIYGSGSLLMAYTFNKPVLVSDIPTFREETEEGKTGILFKSEDPDDLARKMHQFIKMSDIDRTVLTNNVRKLTEEKYNWKICAKKTLEVYR